MSTLAILKLARKKQVDMRLLIREMERDDLEALRTIIGDNYSEESVTLATQEIVSARSGMKPQPVYFVALVDDTILGVIGICDSFMDTRVYEIFWVNVRPDWQGIGIGKRLVKRALEHAVKREAAMLLLTAKEDVIEFYRSLGFDILAPVETDESKDYLMKARPVWALKRLNSR